jgi:hypothetical protein
LPEPSPEVRGEEVEETRPGVVCRLLVEVVGQVAHEAVIGVCIDDHVDDDTVGKRASNVTGFPSPERQRSRARTSGTAQRGREE